MKVLLSVCIIILAFVSNSFASLMFVPLDEGVKNSDLIIVGTLREISENETDSGTYGKGKIFVQQFIAGNVKTMKGFVLKAGDILELNYIENFSCVMGSHKRIENKKGIFLIKLTESGEIQSQDFRVIEDLTEINKLLKKNTTPNNIFKTIKIQNEAEQYSEISRIEESNSQTSKISYCLYSNRPQTKYYPFLALLIILGSFSLYYLLYRSRFKIR